MEKILNKLPPSWQNNSRDIVKRKMESFYKSKSESKAMDLESKVEGLNYDFKDEDNEWSPRQGRR